MSKMFLQVVRTLLADCGPESGLKIHCGVINKAFFQLYAIKSSCGHTKEASV